MSLTKQEVEHIANLARLKLTEEEIDRYSGELSSILEYVEKIQKVDTNNVESTSQVTGLKNAMREDKIEESGICQELVDCSSDHDDGFLKVPKIFDGK